MMSFYTAERISEHMKQFSKRAETERDYCVELFEHATVRLLASKYAYYEKDKPFESDLAYDISEKSWYIMGRSLGLLAEDETSPCVGFNENHPKAKEAIALYERIK